MAEYKIDTNRKTIQKKIEKIEEVKAEMKNYKTVALLELRKLPDSLFQSLRKRIRQDGGKVYVLKKPVITRALASNKKLNEHASECNKPVALILTNTSPYEINQFFKKNRKKRAAKVGDIANADIVVPEGDTDLPPGPALSELKAGGLNVQIKAGKIVVSKESVVAKKGETITEPKAKALQTLGVKPFEIMANLIFGFDGEYVYHRDILDMGETVQTDIAESISQALNVSMNASYPTQHNIELLLGSAVRQSVNLAMNAEVYSSSSIELLLSSALRLGMVLEDVTPAETQKEEPKAEAAGTPAEENKG